MRQILNWLQFGFFFVSVIGCSSVQRLEEAVFHNSTLSNLNPAPSAFAPPNLSSEKLVVDPVYLRSQSDYHYTLGAALSLEGDHEKAIESFKLTLVYDQKSVAVRLRLSEEYLKIGLVSEAIEQAEAGIKLDPGNIRGRMLLGGMYSSLKMYSQALTQYKMVLEVEPNHRRAPVLVGAVLAEQGNFDEAELYFDKFAANKK